MQVEIRPYTWRRPGDEYDSYAKYFPFVDGQPRYDIRCATHCRFYSEETLMSAYGPCNCRLLVAAGTVEGVEEGFCGPICGSFQMREEAEAQGIRAERGGDCVDWQASVEHLRPARAGVRQPR